MATGVTQRRPGEEAHPRVAEKQKVPEKKGKVGGFSVTVHRAFDKVADAIASFKGIFRDNIRSLHIKEEKLLKEINTLPKLSDTSLRHKEIALKNAQRNIKHLEKHKGNGDALQRAKKNEKTLLKGISDINKREKLKTELDVVQMKIGQMEKASRSVLTVEQRLHGAEKTLDQLIKKLEKPIERSKTERGEYKTGGFTIEYKSEKKQHTRIDPGAIVELNRVKQEIHKLETSLSKEIQKNPASASQLLNINKKIVEAELILHHEQLKLKRAQLKQVVEQSPRGSNRAANQQLAQVEKLLAHVEFELKPLGAKFSEKYIQLVQLNRDLVRAQREGDPDFHQIRSKLAIVKKECATVVSQLEKELNQKFPARFRQELELN